MIFRFKVDEKTPPVVGGVFCIIVNMETKSKVRICPFCAHHGHRLNYRPVNVRYEDGETEVHDVWQMECRCCGAMGPTESRPDLAIESWNMLQTRPAHSDDPLEEDFTFDPDEIKGISTKQQGN